MYRLNYSAGKYLIYIITLYSFLLSVPFFLSAQIPYAKHLTVEDGLPSNDIYDMLYDYQGYVWFASSYGVTRYDGYEFVTYTTKDGLPENSTLELFEDDQHRIWFYSAGNHISYMQDGAITTLDIPDEIRQDMGNKGRYIGVDSNGAVFFASMFGVYLQSADGWTDISDSLLLHASENLLDSIILEKYAGNHDNEKPFVVVDFLLRKGIVFFNIPEGSTKRIHGVRLLCIGINEYIIYQGRDLTQLYQDSIVYFYRFNIEDEIITSYYDSRSNIWVSERNSGLLRYNRTLLDANPVLYFEGDVTSAIFEDREGNYWFSSANGAGVHIVPSLQFKTHLINGSNEYYVNSIECDSAEMYLSILYEGVYFLNIGNSSAPILKPFPFPKGVSFNVLDLLCHTDGTLWGASSHEFRFDKLGNQLPIYSERKGNAGCYQVIELRDGTVCFIGRKGIRYFYNPDSVDHIFPVVVRNPQKACEGLEGELFIGGYNGLSVLKDKKEYFFGKNIPFLNERISDLKFYNPYLYIGTRGNGLIVFDGTKIIIQFTEDNGLASNNLNAVFEDANGNVWIGSDKGLDHLIFQDSVTGNYTIQNYNIWDGLPSNEIHDIVSVDSQIFLGTSKGMVSFYPEELNSRVVEPILLIESVTVHDSIIDFTNPDKLSYDENTLSIFYKGISYKDPGNLQYKYQLKGQDKDWVNTKNTSVRFADLRPGDYEFKLLSANSKGHWNTNPVTFSFSIGKHFSQTWWFKVLMILAVLGIIFFVFIQILKSQKRRAEAKTCTPISLNKGSACFQKAIQPCT